MAAPTGSHGGERAVAEFVAPSVGVLLAVVLTQEFLGAVMAGVVYLLLTGGVLLGIYTSARHWNVRYTAGFVVSGIVLLVMVPGIVSEIVHPIFGFLGTLIGVVFLIAMVFLLIEKSGLDELLREL